MSAEIERDRRRIAELDRRLAEHKRRYGSSQGGRDTRTPAQKLVQLRRDYGDERRNPALWDTLPMLLQRHWADAKRAAGEVLAPVERRAFDYSPRELTVSRLEVR